MDKEKLESVAEELTDGLARSGMVHGLEENAQLGWCEQCRYWKGTVVLENGDCHCRPPVVLMSAGGEISVEYPRTGCNDWCKEFEPDPDKMRTELRRVIRDLLESMNHPASYLG